MTPNQTRVPGSESTKHPKYPCNTVLPRCARRKGGRHIDVPCFTYLGGGGRNGRPPIHLNYSLSNRQGPVIQFSSLAHRYHPWQVLAVPNHPMHRPIGLAEKGTTSCPLVFNGQRGLLVIGGSTWSEESTSTGTSLSQNGATMTWMQWHRTSRKRRSVATPNPRKAS